MAEQDVHNFSSSSPRMPSLILELSCTDFFLDRLPTTSASEALKNLSSTPRRPISTRLEGLDSILQGREYDASSQNVLPGGISRGEVTQIYGPPGIGKTSLALQVATSALKSGDSVVWVDTTYTLSYSRLIEFLFTEDGSDIARSELDKVGNGLDAFHHFSAPTLPHMLALLAHPSESFPPRNTSLLVVDNISTLFNLAFPKSSEKSNDEQTLAKKSQAAQWASGRRWAVMDNLISDLGKLAITKGIAVLLISQMTTRIREEARAMLYPTLTGNAWESGVATRIVLFRDWLSNNSETSSQGESQPGARFVGVTKAKNVSYENMGRLAIFRLVKHGLEEIRINAADIKTPMSPILPIASLKRRYGEVADSESEDGDAASDHEFGWDGDEATLEAGDLVG